MPQIYDMGPTVYFLSEERHAEDFFLPKKYPKHGIYMKYIGGCSSFRLWTGLKWFRM
jgi:hypothetical protein